MSTLFVNACLRDEESRTLALCKEYLDGKTGIHEVNLANMHLEPFYKGEVAYRTQLANSGVFDDRIFDLSKQFAEADEIVIGAPYWDLSFPAALKVYIEHISVCGITFHYNESGAIEGLCKADTLTYITTGGGPVKAANFGYEYICGIANMFGIPDTRLIAAENLDIIGIDVEAQLDIARVDIERIRG